MNNTDRLKELDVLRAISFIFVVEQHTMGGYSRIDGISYSYFQIFKFFYTLAKPAVAAFLCISAISLFYSYSKEFDWKKYYIKRITKVFIPYTLWSITYLFVFDKYTNLTNLFIQLLSGDAAYHLWYMAMIIRLYIYFPLILFAAKKIHEQNLILRILVFLTLVLSYYQVSKYQSLISNKFTHFIFNNPTEIQAKIINVSPLFWSLYFILGIYIALNYEAFKKRILKFKIPVIFIYISLFVYAYLNEMEKVKFNRGLSLLYFVFSILAWYIISVSLSNKIKIYSFFNFISKYSFASYMYHILVVGFVVNNVRIYLNLNDWLAIGLTTWMMTSILTPVLIKIISYIPYSEFITGTKKKHYKNKFIDMYKAGL
ncbi:MAG: acyltransferase [Clostridiaceae bacterium]